MSTQIGGHAADRRIAPSLAALLGREMRGEPLAHDDGKTGARLEEFGYTRPGWYATFKAEIAERTGDADAFVEAAAAAGLAEVRIDRIAIDAGLDDPALAAAWRLNMPHTIGFVAGLDPATRAALRVRTVAALPLQRHAPCGKAPRDGAATAEVPP